jgi:hypothetical protein
MGVGRTMRRRMPERLSGVVVVAAATAAVAVAGAPVAGAATTQYRGAFKCDADGRPLAGARVELWEQHLRWLPKLPPNIRLRNVTRANGDGAWAFRISGDESNWFLRVVLVGQDAAVHDFPWPWDWFADTLRSQNDVPLHDYGTQGVAGYQCVLWNALSDAGRDYREQVGSAPPQGVTTAEAGAVTAGTPFTLYDDIWWPSGYPVYSTVSVATGTATVSTAKHEFAHVVRHLYDGSRTHFLGDALYYWYLRHHSAASCDPTNSGFAFNEGWAEFWEGEVMTPCPDAATGLNERNVAAQLKQLQTSCRLSLAQMVGVLAANPRRIHSIDEYTRALNCTPPHFIQLRRPRPPKPIAAILAERRALVVRGRAFVATLGRTVKRLRGATAAAAAVAKRPASCPSRPCVLLLERRLRPVLLAGQLATARAVRSRFAFLANVAAMRRFGTTSFVAQMRRLVAVRGAARADAGRIAVLTLRKARSAARAAGAGAAGLRVLAEAQAAAARGDAAVLTGMAPVTPGPVAAAGPSPPELPPPSPLPETPPSSPETPPAPPATPPILPTTPPAEPPVAPPTLTPLPDLVIDQVSLSSDLLQWHVVVRNAGSADAPATQTGIAQPGVPEVLVGTPALAAGATAEVISQCPYGSIADATVRADAGGAVAEADETDNGGDSGPLGITGRCLYP